LRYTALWRMVLNYVS